MLRSNSIIIFLVCSFSLLPGCGSGGGNGGGDGKSTTSTGSTNTTNSQTVTVAAVSLMKTTSADAYSPALAMSEDGKAFVVWSEGDYPSCTLWFNHYEPKTGWGTAQEIGTGVGNEDSAKVALTSSGFAILVWRRDINNSREILAAAYDTATGWGTAKVLDTSGLGIDPDVTLDDSGNACAIWNRYDALNYKNTVMVARYASNGWYSPQILQHDASTPVQQISGNNSGMTAVIWNQVTPVAGQFWHKYNTYVSLFKAGAGWEDPQPVGNDVFEMDNIFYYNADSTPGHFSPRISVDKQGNALALWTEVYCAGCAYQTVFNTYETGKGWGTPQQLNNIGIPSDKIVLDNSGSAYISWTNNVKQITNGYISSIFFAKYDSVNGWITKNVLDKYPYYCFNSSILAGKNGGLLVFWMQSTGAGSQLWMKSYSPLSGWCRRERLDYKAGNVDEYRIALDAEGQAIIIWTQYSGVHRNIWAKLIR